MAIRSTTVTPSSGSSGSSQSLLRTQRLPWEQRRIRWAPSCFSFIHLCTCLPYFLQWLCCFFTQLAYSALIWQKEASDKSEISRKRAKCVCHLHWRQWNIRMSYLTYLLVGWVFLHEIWRRRRAHYVNYENINNSNFYGMSLASFCQSRAVLFTKFLPTWKASKVGCTHCTVPQMYALENGL